MTISGSGSFEFTGWLMDGVAQVGVIRNWDFNLLVDIEDAYCEFVGACLPSPPLQGESSR